MVIKLFVAIYLFLGSISENEPQKVNLLPLCILELELARV
jgi:hypothetical protein